MTTPIAIHTDWHDQSDGYKDLCFSFLFPPVGRSQNQRVSEHMVGFLYILFTSLQIIRRTTEVHDADTSVKARNDISLPRLP